VDDLFPGLVPTANTYFLHSFMYYALNLLHSKRPDTTIDAYSLAQGDFNDCDLITEGFIEEEVACPEGSVTVSRDYGSIWAGECIIVSEVTGPEPDPCVEEIAAGIRDSEEGSRAMDYVDVLLGGKRVPRRN